MISSGMYSFFRCHSCACGTTSASENLRICSWIAACVSSRPESPKVVAPGCAAISSASRALTPSSLPAATRSATRILEAADVGAGDAERLRRGRSRTWLMGMPPAICARYSAKPAARMQRFDLAEPAFVLQAARPDVHLAQAFDGRREPGEAMRRVLRLIDAAASATLARTPAWPPQDALGGADGVLGALEHMVGCQALRSFLELCRRHA